MTFYFEKIISSSNNSSKGLQLSTTKYIVYFQQEEQGYYYIRPTNDYFIYWEEDGTLQSGLIDKWEKKISFNNNKIEMNTDGIKYNHRFLQYNPLTQKNTRAQISFLLTHEKEQFFVQIHDTVIKKELNQKIVLNGTIDTNLNSLDFVFSIIAFIEIILEN